MITPGTLYRTKHYLFWNNQNDRVEKVDSQTLVLAVSYTKGALHAVMPNGAVWRLCENITLIKEWLEPVEHKS
jgi:hypothetical protein